MWRVLCLVIVCAAAASASVVRVPLKRVISVRERKLADGTWADYVKTRPTRTLHGSQPLRDYDDVVYVGELAMGTPAQVFTVILDTGSANLWVPDKKCGCGDCSILDPHCTSGLCPAFCCARAEANPCDGKQHFHQENSTSYVHDGKHWCIRYGTGSACGFLGKDKVCFGNSSLCVQQQRFGQATSIAQFFAGEPFDGICGLAFKSIAVDHVTPPFQNLLPQLDAPLFSVWMTALGLQQGAVGGQITYGALDTTNCDSSVDWVPLTSATYWQFRIQNVKIGHHHHKHKWQVISDTGTSLIIGPVNVIRFIAIDLGGRYHLSDKLYYVHCDKKPKDLVFTINGKDYPIHHKNYIVPVGNGKCILGIEGIDFGGGGFFPSWILGTTFIREYCNVYDYANKRIGFAKALN